MSELNLYSISHQTRKTRYKVGLGLFPDPKYVSAWPHSCVRFCKRGNAIYDKGSYINNYTRGVGYVYCRWECRRSFWTITGPLAHTSHTDIDTNFHMWVGSNWIIIKVKYTVILINESDKPRIIIKPTTPILHTFLSQLQVNIRADWLLNSMVTSLRRTTLNW